MGAMSATQLPQGGAIPPLTLGLRLSIAMEYGEVSREKMADEIGVTPSTITRWTHDQWKRPPMRAALEAWAALCGVDSDWLIYGRGAMPTPPAFPALVTDSDAGADNTNGKPRTRRIASEHGLELHGSGKMALSSAAA